MNCFVQRGNVAMVLRGIPGAIPSFEELRLPATLKQVALEKRGLVMFVGATGSGKSTSLAAMVDCRNENSHGHIVTIEDPIEFVHPNKNCLVSQREVGVDTDSWESALKEQMKKSRNLGMQTFDQALFDLYESNQISYEDAVRFADSQHEVRLAIKLQSTRLHKNPPAAPPGSYPTLDPISGGR